MEPFLKDDSVDTLEEELHENDTADDGSIGKDSLVLDEDSPITDAVEVAISTEEVKAESPPERSLSLSDAEEFFVDANAVVLTDNSGVPEDVESENGISKACDETDLPDPSPSDGTNDASELWFPLKDDAGSGCEADAAHSVGLVMS